MKYLVRSALLAAAVLSAQGCDVFDRPTVERVCPALPQVMFTPDPEKGYGVKDELEVNIIPYGFEDGEKFECAATLCFTLDGSEPQEGRAATHCLPGPVMKIPLKTSTCIKYYVVGVDGSQSTTQEECYRVEPPPVSTCEPNSKASKDPITVKLTSSKQGGTIFYTLDGSDPDPEGETGETLSGQNPVELKIEEQGTTTVKFRAQDQDGNLEEKPNTCDYKYDSIAPVTTIDPAGGAVPAGQEVNLFSSELARIYYSLDGSDPDPTRLEESANGTTKIGYSEQNVTLNQSTVLRVFSVDYVGNEETPIQEQTYFIDGKPALRISPQPGAYVETAITVTLTASYPGTATGEIWYTVDGSQPGRHVGTSILYTGPITQFNKEGEYTLRYVAREYPSGKQTEAPAAVFLLGANGRPFYRQVEFNDPAMYNAEASSKSVEYNTHKGYARLRPKIPVSVGSGYDGITGFQPTFGAFNFPQEIQITDSYLIAAFANSLRVYPIESFSGVENNVPENVGFFPNWCSESDFRGAMLGLNIFVYETNKLGAITPWTGRFANCGGFARWNLNSGAASTHPYIKANLTQFDGGTGDPFIADLEEVNDVNDPNFNNLPRTDSDLFIDSGLRNVVVLPVFDGANYKVEGYFAETGAKAITSATTTSGRPTAVRSNRSINVVGDLLAVGDDQGEIYMLTLSSLSLVPGQQLSVACDAGNRCRINKIAWYNTGGKDYLLAAVGQYGADEGGRIAVIEVASNGSMSLLSSNALPAADPFVINSVVESIAVLPNKAGETENHAVIGLRDQGLLVVSLANIAAGTVHSRGYVKPSDVNDNAFWATDITPYPSGGNQKKAAVIDAGRTAQAMDAGFRIFDFSNAHKFETSGTLLTTNLNTSGKGISRVKLMTADPDPLPLGLTITFVADNQEVPQPVNINTEVSFPNQPQDVRLKLAFASPNTGATELKINYLQLKFTPVE